MDFDRPQAGQPVENLSGNWKSSKNIVFVISWVWQNWFGFLGNYMASKKVPKNSKKLVEKNLEGMGS